MAAKAIEVIKNTKADTSYYAYGRQERSSGKS